MRCLRCLSNRYTERPAESHRELDGTQPLPERPAEGSNGLYDTGPSSQQGRWRAVEHVESATLTCVDFS